MKKTVIEEPLPPEFRLAIMIHKLARVDCIYTIREISSLVKSTVCVVVTETCRAIIDTSWDDTVAKYFLTRKEDYKESLVKCQFP